MNRSAHLKLLQFTDMHLLADPNEAYKGFNMQASFDQVIAHAKTHHWPPDAILLTGDLVQDELEATYHRLSDIAQVWQVPVYCLPGNHDVLPFFHKILPSKTVSTVPAFSLQKNTNRWRIIMLDSTRDNEVYGYLSANELNRLESELSAAEDPTLICLHHQPVAVGSKWMDALMLQNADDFWRIIEANHCQNRGQALNMPVKGVAWGHVHQSFDAHKEGIQLMGSPSTGRQFSPTSEEFEVDNVPAGYRVLELHTDGSIKTKIERVDHN